MSDKLKPLRYQQHLEASVVLACQNCGAPGAYHSDQRIKNGWPRCHVTPDDPLHHQPVGQICPNCGAERPANKPLGEILYKEWWKGSRRPNCDAQRLENKPLGQSSNRVETVSALQASFLAVGDPRLKGLPADWWVINPPQPLPGHLFRYIDGLLGRPTRGRADLPHLVEIGRLVSTEQITDWAAAGKVADQIGGSPRERHSCRKQLHKQFKAGAAIYLRIARAPDMVNCIKEILRENPVIVDGMRVGFEGKNSLIEVIRSFEKGNPGWSR
jgi:hypothetical protein